MTPLPIGDVFFRHDLLKCNGFDPSNPEHLMEHIHVETLDFGWEDRRAQERDSLGLVGRTQKKAKYYRWSKSTYHEGETIKSMTVCDAERVDSIKFETSEGGQFSAGGTGGTPYQLDAGYITGAQRRAADEIGKLGIGLSDTDIYHS
ncbi:hypothetical protein BP00DRAFT_449874 [Aspergillus indologenus CBS 114.80]|uniref:Uncharacterized protein n=1 Tax=Aspergillus indologenus CBS 114.80 TaxID=1450541 RepID=A0A2V5IHB0_9EURO|nr:hypothetical protein BP00DRAFT_449874 [Aspergillus indologenus CBS 114.80]